MHTKIAVIPGDGIGNEVTPAAVEVLTHALDLYGIKVDWTWFDWGSDYFLKNGSMMPKDGIDILANYQGIFLGAVGHPEVPDHESLWGLLIPIRQAFDQYINLRPVKSFEGVDCPITLRKPIDMLIVRENTEGEYTKLGGRFGQGRQVEFAIQESIFTKSGVERVANYAFELAAQRNNLVTSATKSNGIIHTMPFWDEIVEIESKNTPGVKLEKVLIDALAAHLVAKPEHFDIIVASNLFGDIISDLAAALVGGLGLAPSANLNPERLYPSMFEPVHGSAPDIAGKGVANPVAAIWSGAMMLEHLGFQESATRVMAAIAKSLANPESRTKELGGSGNTASVTKAITSLL